MQQIPVRATVIAAYKYTFGNIGKLVGLVWLPALLTFAGSYVFVRPYLYLMAINPGPDEMLQHGQLILGVYGFYIAAVFFFAMMAAGIARDVLHPDREAGVYHFPPLRSVLRVAVGLFGMLLLVALVFGAIGTVLALAGKALPGPALDAIFVVVALAMIYAVVRLGFLLVPAATEEDRCYGLTRSWLLSGGHFWRLVLILLCSAVPVGIVSMLAQLAILGPGYYAGMHISGDLTSADTARMLLMADRFWLIAGVNFFLTPFAYGLYVAPMALVYGQLTQETPDAGTTDDDADKTDADKAEAPQNSADAATPQETDAGVSSDAPEKDDK